MRPYITDVSAEANAAADSGKKVLVEGTQGSGLSLYHSNFYPKTTSRDTNAAGFISEVGLSPRLVSEIVLVFRTFPIRVAGAQAGPLSHEITWEELRRESNSLVPLDEYTSVTHKLRRVGRFDWEAACRAVMLNRPTRLALNFVDYLGFENRAASNWDDLNLRAKGFIEELEDSGVPVNFIGTGPQLAQGISRSCPSLSQSLPQTSPDLLFRAAGLRRS